MIKWIYKPSGLCPVQSEGYFWDRYFYFRARYSTITIEFAGSLFVSSVGKVETVTLLQSTTYYLTFDTGSSSSGVGHGFAVGDIIRAQRVNLNSLQSTSPSQSITLLYRSDLEVTGIESLRAITASLIGSTTPPSGGMEFVRLGNTTNTNRQGTLYLTSDDAYSPFMDVVDGITSHAAWNTATGSGGVKVRIGKISGISSPTFGTLDGYGMWASGSVYLEGGINATTGFIGGWQINRQDIKNDYITISNNATSSIKVSWLNYGLRAESSGAFYSPDDFSTLELYNYITLNDTTYAQTGPFISLGPGATMASTGIFLSGSGDFNFQTNNNQYIRKSGNDLEIKSQNFNLTAGSTLKITNSTGSLLTLGGTSYSTAPIAFSGSGIAKFGNINIDGNNGGFIRSSTTTLTSGAGIFLSGSGEALIGSASGHRISFTDNNLTISASNATLRGNSVEISSSNFHLSGGNVILSGNITANTGKIGGFAITQDAITGSGFFLSGSATGDGFFISSSNFNVKASGTITASAGLIGGFITTQNEIRSTGSFSSGSFTSSFISLKATGEITGSSVVIRRLVSGSLVTFFDTETGVFDGVNLGRPIVSHNDGITLIATDQSAYLSASDATYPVQLLRGENRALIAFSMYATRGSATLLQYGTQITIAAAITSSTNTATTSSIYYNNWGTETILYTSPSANITGTSTEGSFVLSPAISQSSVPIPQEFQGKYCLIRLKAFSNASGGSVNSSTRVSVRNLTITTTRTFGAQAATDPGIIGELKVPPSA